MKKEEELENFTESIFDDFISISRVDEIIHPKAVSMLEETEGITRVTDILESIIWTGSVTIIVLKMTYLVAIKLGNDIEGEKSSRR
jgi:hypothetical protein